MRHAYLYILFATLSFTGLGLPQEIRIPGPIRSYVDSAYPGWRLSKISEYLRKAFFRSRHLNPSFIRGDFDRNGKWDYALQITYLDSGREFRATIAFLAIDTGFRPLLLERVPEDPEYYITLNPKGAERYDFEADKPFRCPSDGISIGYRGNSGRTFFFKHGKFYSITTAD
jgi:hypothetical protein